MTSGRLLLCQGVVSLLIACTGCSPWKDTPYSTVVEASDGELLGARTASDGQWRFPPCDSVPRRFAKAIVLFEDRYYRYHPGVNPLSLARALADNARSGRIVSGGSTITMQVARLSRGKQRNLWQKGVEALMALGLEFRYTKDEILAMYCSHAPFGGNVVGLEAASWRYFGRPSSELSWAQVATLAVLPNAPSSIHPGRNRNLLEAKRNRLLRMLLDAGELDSLTFESALEEPLPGAPLPLPSYASHYVERQPKGKRIRSAINLPVQRAVEDAICRRSDELAREGVADMAAVVMDNTSGDVIAYVGNSSPGRLRHGVDVDIASSPRSTGSILKPFLYAASIGEGVILPESLLPDVPVNLGGFTPQNFDRQYYGAVHADEALSRSLNIPFVFLLRYYGVAKFQSLLREYGITTLEKDASHYGLSLILGGGECTLEQIAAAYCSMAREGNTSLAVWYTLEALKEVNRPDQLDYHLIHSLRKASWKTGTSYGFRDAWAVGITPDYTIGVWAGNAGGASVAGLTGARTAGPAMFDILNLLPYSGACFVQPSDGTVAMICPDSGHLAGMDCPVREPVLLPSASLESEPCPYHGSGEFVLPPAMEWFYKPWHPEYKGASRKDSDRVMEFIYPATGSVLNLPRQLSGEVEGAVFRLAHRNAGTTVWWHLDGKYIGETVFAHQMKLAPPPGKHTVTVVDPTGESSSVTFSVSD